MNTIDAIKGKIQKLYESDPHIHVNVSKNRPKVVIRNQPAVITGVYRNVFQIEECSSGTPKRYTLQYTDVYIGQVEILEILDERSYDD